MGSELARRQPGPSASPAAAAPDSALGAFFAGVDQRVPADLRIAGRAPDHAGAWVDEKDHLAVTPAEKIAEAHAIAEASVLAVSMDKTDDRDGRHRILETLDRVDDPATRKRMLAHYRGIAHETLDASIENATWHGTRDKQQALDLISPERDAAHLRLAGLSPEEKAALDKKIQGAAQQVLSVTRSDDANDNARTLLDTVGQLEAHEVEALRSEIRAQTGGRSIYGEIDRSMSGDKEDAAIATLKGDPVHSATMALATADGDPEAMRATLAWMSPAQIAEMKERGEKVGMSSDWIARSVPENRRAEIQAAVDAKTDGKGKNAAADGEHIGELFSDPREGMTPGTLVGSNKLNDLQTHTQANIVAELSDMAPDQIRTAGATWDATHPGTPWASLAERYRDGDANTYLQLQALMAGDKVGAKAYALRAAMREHDQAGIEAALASPDLDNDADPIKKALAASERLALMGRVRELDAHDRRLTAPLTGADPVGRTLDQQLEESYASYVATEPQLDGMGSAAHYAATYKDADERRDQARTDRIATRDLLDDGELSLTTKIHRAREAGDTKGESKLLQGIGSNAQLRDVRLDYLATYDDQLFHELDSDRFRYLPGAPSGDDDEAVQLRRRIAIEAESTEALRIRQIGERGVLAERSYTDQVADQQAINDKTHSDRLELHEWMRLARGGNYGTENLMQAGHARLSGLVDATTGELREGVTPAQLASANQTLVGSQELQGEAKQKYAEESAAAAGTLIRLGALLAPGAYPLLDLAANLSGMAIKGDIEGGDYTQDRQNLDWLTTGTSLGADLIGMGAGAAAAGGKISDAAAMALSTTAQVGSAVITSTAANDSAAQTGASAVNVVLGSLLPIVGKAAGGLIRGTSNLARWGRGIVGTGVQGAGAYGINGGNGSILDIADSFGGAAGDQLGGHTHAHDTEHPHARPHATERAHPTENNPHVVANGHFAEDGPHAPSRAAEDAGRRSSEPEEGHARDRQAAHDHPQPHPDQRAHDNQADTAATAASSGSETDNATARRRARRAAEIPPAERARHESYVAEHGHPGADLHSHFMGVTSVDDFATFMGKDGKTPLGREEMLSKMRDAVRMDADYQKHYSLDEAGNKVFDHTGGGIHRQGGHAFENVRTIEAAYDQIAELRKQPSTPELEARIAKLAGEAVDNAMNASQNTPYDGAYSIRDTMVKTYIDPKQEGQTTQPYRNFTRMTLEALARDGILYSEQSQSVKKLSQGNVPPEMVREELAKFNDERAKEGKPPIEMRFLAMIETRFLGAEGSDSAGTATDWQKQLDAVRGMLKRGDVMGVDVASPETSEMAKGGKQLETRMEQLALILAQESKAAGRKLALRPHVGEGYIEMPNDPTTGNRMGFDRDHSREHYEKARSNLDALIGTIDRLSTTPGPDGKPIYDPKDPAFEVRFGHATHATPEQAEKMAKLGIIVEVNLNSNAVSGSLQDSATKPQGRSQTGHLNSLDDHSLLALAGAGVEIHLSTDGQSVMRTQLSLEHDRARQILTIFRGDPTRGQPAKGTMPVTRDVFAKAHPDIPEHDIKPPYELEYAELPQDQRTNIDAAYQRMVDDSILRQSQIKTDDTRDTRPLSTAGERR